MFPTLLKITFIPGLKDVVLNEIDKYSNIHIVEIGKDEIYLEPTSNFKVIRELRSILTVFAIKRNIKLNPLYLSNHKSIIGELIDSALYGTDTFRSFKLSCAGSESKEIHAIEDYITERFKINPTKEADMEIYIGKLESMWEVGVRLTKRPLSLRGYRVANIKGGLNPTIAYAMNTFCNVNLIHSYLNIFSGSGTLLIEAGLTNPKLQLVGFDIDGKSNACAIQNIKKAGLIKQIALSTTDIFSSPHVGKFDVITSDLPFGMQIGKDEDLEKLYTYFVHYCEENLNPSGTLVVYTTEHKLLEKILKQSTFNIVTTLNLTVSTVVNAYIYPHIFVCK